MELSNIMNDYYKLLKNVRLKGVENQIETNGSIYQVTI